MSRFRACGGAVLVLLALLTASARADDQRWSDARLLFPGSSGARVAAVPGPGFVAVANRRGDDAGIFSATLGPGGAFGSPVRITEPGYHWSISDLITGPSGDLAVISVSGAIVRRPGDGWQPPATIAPRYIGGAGFDAAGNLAALYSVDNWNDDPDTVTDYTVTRSPDGTVTKPRQVGPPRSGPGPVPVLSVGPDGTSRVIWWQGGMKWAVAPPGSPFGAVAPMGVDWDYATYLRVLTDAAGDMLALWFAGDHLTLDHLYPQGPLMASFRPAGGDWGPAKAISGANARPYAGFDWDAAMNARGDAIVAWPGSGPDGGRIEMTYRPAGGDFEPVTAGPSFESSMEPRVAIGANGDAVALHGHSDTLESFDHPAGGSFCRDERVPLDPDAPDPPDGGGAPRFPDVAVGPTGEAVAVWGHEAGDRGNFWSRHQIGSCAGPPVVTHFRLRRAAGDLHAARAAKRSAFTYWLTKPASVTITVRRLSHGRRHHVATLHAEAQRGDNRDRLAHDVERRIRQAGRYEAELMARDFRGRVSKRKKLHFKVER